MSKKRICLDAGHYGSKYNAGAVPGYYESAIVWKLTMMEKEALEKLGVEVVLTRQNINDNPELTARGKMAKGCDLFVSNHTDWCSTPSVSRASVIFLTDRKDTDIDEKSAEFANQLAKVVQTTMGVDGFRAYSRLSDNDRDGNGSKDDNYYGVLHGGFVAGVPSVISEHSFHSNVATCNWLMNDDNLRKLAEACATCMATFVGATTESNTVEEPKQEKPDVSTSLVKEGDIVSIEPTATYYNGKDIPTWVEQKLWIVKSVKGDRVVIDKSVDGKSAINSPVNVNFLTVVKEEVTEPVFKPYLVRVNIQKLNIRKGPGTNYDRTGKYTGVGTFTIVEEQKGAGSDKGWGKLKSEAGWISLDFATRV